MQRDALSVTGLLLFSLGWGFAEWGQRRDGIRDEVFFTGVKTRRQFDIRKRAAHVVWDAPSDLALSLEIALCLHAV